MKTTDILNKIRLQYNQLTKSQKKLADYSLNNPHKVLELSISDLAEICEVSDATVFRFCCDIGLQGYQDFKRTLADNLDSTQTIAPASSASKPASTEGRLEHMLQKNVSALYETKKLINLSQIDIAIDWMSSAEKVLFLGVGASYSTAVECYNHFARILPSAAIALDTHIQIVAASTLSSKDTAIVISYSGSSRESVEMAKAAKMRGARIICITHFLKSPLTLYADLVLLCSTNELEVESHSITSEIAQLFIIDVLFQEFYRKNKNQCKEIQRITSENLLPHVY